MACCSRRTSPSPRNWRLLRHPPVERNNWRWDLKKSIEQAAGHWLRPVTAGPRFEPQAKILTRPSLHPVLKESACNQSYSPQVGGKGLHMQAEYLVE